MFNLIILTEVLNLLGFGILNKFDACDKLVIDLQVYKLLKYLRSNYYSRTQYAFFYVSETVILRTPASIRYIAFPQLR